MPRDERAIRHPVGEGALRIVERHAMPAGHGSQRALEEATDLEAQRLAEAQASSAFTVERRSRRLFEGEGGFLCRALIRQHLHL
jgi:hypothetical protein